MNDTERANPVPAKYGEKYPLTSNNTPVRREERRRDLITLLRTLTSVGETLQRGDSGGKSEPGSRLLQMPAAWHYGDYDVLLENLRKLRRHGPRHYWNVDQRYISPERTNRYLVRRGNDYFEAVARFTSGEREWYAGERLVTVATNPAANAEILATKTEPRARVLRARGKAQAILVRAIVERWDPRVERRPLNVGLDFLLAYMPAQIRLPSEVRNAA